MGRGCDALWTVKLALKQQKTPYTPANWWARGNRGANLIHASLPTYVHACANVFSKMLLDVKSDRATLWQAALNARNKCTKSQRQQLQIVPPTRVYQNIARVKATVYDAALSRQIGKTHEQLVDNGTDGKRG